MKKNLLLIFMFLVSSAELFSQNLVLNPDFEIYGIVPCGWTNTSADFAAATSGWTSPTAATPDIFSTLISNTCSNYQPLSTVLCNGYQSPHSGNIFAGFYTQVGGIPWREYLQAQLSQPMVIGETYRVSLYISLGDNSQFATDNIGIGFSTTMTNLAISNEIGTTPEINFTNVITDTSGWTFLCDTIVATDAWQYLIIGNYFSDVNTTVVNFNPNAPIDRSYYYCDDVSVEHIFLNPTAMFNAPNHICPGTCTSFNNLSTNATSFLWSFPGANPAASTDINPTNICYSSPGSYSVTLIAGNGNTTDTLTLNNFMTVFPFPPPQGINQNGDTLFANPGATSYQWYFNGNIINAATNYFYVATQSGNYNVVATDGNGCEVEAAINNVIAGMNQLAPDSYRDGNSQLAIFPNPADNQITISNLPSGGAEITIFNSLGEVVYRARAKNNVERIDVSMLAEGAYLIGVTSKEWQQRLGFVKHD